MKQKIRAHHDLEVYQMAFKMAMNIFTITKSFPKEETYSMTDQLRRSSRSVCANIAEGFRKRRYKAAMIAKYSDAETEAAETQVWRDFAYHCQYLDQKNYQDLKQQYDYIIGKIITIINSPDQWVIK
ncbi:four helix bundle protein [Flavilitoribacter nigricans]|uniref:Four helix bundle protein n=1 Tax=Flavilitoribacter nigricans (strain ATCC 23147 / DSM 23189 / NBRC 102662 / NCIMB 1420 / SS-2) TaxID=1122177 RepID=A0A2D0N0N6_FLAN2|nr:four helix bundle protein [Flavilitoribacter nigricans]PHN02074.1 four helix bundle protein [Flavilitoribacter nigricans DSM 23189 = NBRC 102662]